MDSSSTIKIFGITVSALGAGAWLDAAPLFTIMLTLLAALTSGILAASYAVREAKKEIDVTFSKKVRQLHNEHKNFVEAVVDDRIKG